MDRPPSWPTSPRTVGNGPHDCSPKAKGRVRERKRFRRLLRREQEKSPFRVGRRSRRCRSRRTPAPPRKKGVLTPDLREKLLGLDLHEGAVAARLDVQAQERLGIGAAQVQAPLGKLHAQAVDVRDLALRTVFRLDAGDGRRDVGDFRVDLARARVRGDHLVRRGRRAFCPSGRRVERRAGTGSCPSRSTNAP